MTTIHQPSSRMFHMFDKLLLISDGHAIYHGKARDSMHHFSSLGFVQEIPMNPAEFLLDLATGNLDDISVPEALCGSPNPQEFRSQVIRQGTCSSNTGPVASLQRGEGRPRSSCGWRCGRVRTTAGASAGSSSSPCCPGARFGSAPPTT
jgi:hypothetical protein